MRMEPTGPRVALLPVLVILSALAGCGGGEVLLSYLGGGLPPGEPDIGGVVLAAAPATASVGTAAAGDTPVVGATVELHRGTRKVGQATTGAGGYFRFENPSTGRYRVRVIPPAGSGLKAAQRDLDHQFGQQTFVEIVLQRE